MVAKEGKIDAQFQNSPSFWTIEWKIKCEPPPCTDTEFISRQIIALRSAEIPTSQHEHRFETAEDGEYWDGEI